jgi:competence protein ComEA
MRQFLGSAIRWGRTLLAVGLLSTFASVFPPTIHAQTKTSPVNVNTADLTALETLPGVGPATAQKIIDGRPYKTAADLEKVPGLSKAKVDAFKDQITFGRSASTATTKSPSTSTKSSASGGKVNVNTADLTTLETLPGVGAATAQKIIDGRPYQNAADLEQIPGLSKTKVEAMEDEITFGRTTKSTEPKSTTSKTTPSTSQNQNKPSSTLPPTGQPSGKLAPGQKININTASAEQLDSLFGIGPTKSQAIVDYRDQHGKFQSIDDIMKVPGIKEGEFAKIKDYIKVK